MNFSAYSIKNPLASLLFFTLLMIGGIIGFQKMNITQFPKTDFPLIITTIPLSGASPEQLENDIAKKLENKLANVDGIKNMRTTLQTGSATVSAEFTLEKDTQEALDEVRSAVNEIRGDLPASANDPIIAKANLMHDPIQTYSIASSSLNEADLSWYVKDTLKKRLSGIKGVGDVKRIGGIERIIKVEADINRLNALQMNISSLSQQIYANQKDFTGGETELGGRKQLIRIMGAVNTANDLKFLQVSVPTGGSEPLYNIATISDDYKDRSSVAKLNNQSVVAFNIFGTMGSDSVATAKEIDASLQQLQKDNPSLTITKIVDQVTYVEDSYKDSINMLIEGGVLAVIVVFLFLLNWRATFVAAVALPLSVVPAFLFMWLLDFSLNMLSLLALSLVIGILVDDAIVEIENIVRHLRMGKTPMEAAKEAADEIGLAVIATTFTLIAVFLPTAFMSGIVGQFFKQFGWTAAIAIFMSLLVARLLTPMMAAYIMKPEKHVEEKTGFVMAKYLTFINNAVRYRWLTLLLTLLLFAGSIYLVKFIPKTFIPANNINQTIVTIELTPDSSIEDTTEVADMAYTAIKQIDGVESVLSTVGGSYESTNTAKLDVTFKPREQRIDKTELENKIVEALQQVPTARFSVGLSSGGGKGYEFQLSSENPQLLDQTLQKLMTDIRQLPSVSSVSNDRSLPKPELKVIPDRLAMADKGITASQLANTLRVATTGDFEQSLSKLNLDTRQVPIVVRLSKDSRNSVKQLANLQIAHGVRVGDVAQLIMSNGPSKLKRYNRKRSINITVKPANGELGVIKKDIEKLDSFNNLPAGVQIKETGEAESQKELFTGFAIAMAIGIFCIFGVLLLLFNQVLQSFTILMALPLSIGGAFVGLLITNSSLSLPSLIGFIMLMGIATKNSILLVDYIIIARKQFNMDRNKALIDACRKRARPIIMTSIAMGAGMLPLLLGMGNADPSFRRPMAAAVIGGLVTSTILSLVVIPVIYTIMDDLSSLLKRKPKKVSLNKG